LISLPILISLFFNAPSTTDIYTLSLHDALPILELQARVRRLPRSVRREQLRHVGLRAARPMGIVELAGLESHEVRRFDRDIGLRSEEHTSELQSRSDLVCRLLLEKKKIIH